jgi:hypothetical protein
VILLASNSSNPLHQIRRRLIPHEFQGESNTLACRNPASVQNRQNGTRLGESEVHSKADMSCHEKNDLDTLTSRPDAQGMLLIHSLATKCDA